ncbi:MAG: DNA polymerase I [Clostridia bacterium]|jgi:DNA polymerase-1
MKGKLAVIDGNSLMHRAFYALPLLKNSKGVYTNAVYGFVNMLLKVLENYSPDYVIVAFDKKGPTFRHLEYQGYKAGRKAIPVELAPQFDILKRVLKEMKIGIYEKDGYEADDILGTLSKFGDDNGLRTWLVTGDRDALQLVSEHTRVVLTKKGISDTQEYDREGFVKEYGLTPQQMIDLKGLMGDSSDNIPGVPGVGEKTALKLIKKYGSVENVLGHIDEISGKKLKENLEKHKETALLSKHLATIVRDVPLDIDILQCQYQKAERKDVEDIFLELEFKSLLNKISDGKPVEKEREKSSSKIVRVASEEDMEKVCNKIEQHTSFAFSMEPEFAIAFYEGEEYHFTITSKSAEEGLDLERVLRHLKPYFEDESISKLLHDGKKAILALRNYGVELKGVPFDTMIAAYLINPTENDYNIQKLCERYLDVDRKDLCVQDLFPLKSKMELQMQEMGLHKLFTEIEMPLESVLADMETNGFTVDIEALHELGETFGRQIEKLTEEIYELCGETFNINSTKQLGVVLFEHLGLQIIKRTKTGYSTDIEVLEQLEPYHEVIGKIIEYRQLTKLKSTYVDGLLNVVDKETHKIHSSFNQTVTATGRISSTEPNLQNIPVKMELGREIRRVFKARGPEYVLIDADYSQIELRVLAHIADDPGLIDAFVKNQDIHRRTASQVFNVPMEEVTPSMRNSAKAVNFGIVYGISDFGLAKQLKISRKEAAQYIKSYLESYPGVKRYMEQVVELGKKQGFITTLMGRRRNLPELTSRNRNVRSFGERIAMNTPIQGTAADIIKKAMIQVHTELKRRKLRSRLILQVHDELIIDTYKDELELVKSLVKDLMESVIELKVPLVVDIGVGVNWYDAK